MKKILFIFLVNTISSFGQQLAVPLIGQKRISWCWAASIEMALKKYNVNKNQCDIFNKHKDTIVLDTGTCSCDTFCETGTSPCFSEVIYTCTNMPPEVPYNNVKAIFSKFDFNNVKETCEPLSWDFIKLQIDSGYPILMNTYREREMYGSDHIVLINGYLDIDESNHFIYVKDPWRPCEGCEYLLRYPDFSDTINSPFIQISSFVYDIYPDAMNIIYQKSPNVIICKPKRHLPVSSSNLRALTNSFTNFLEYCKVEICEFCNVKRNICKIYYKKRVLEISINDVLNSKTPKDLLTNANESIIVIPKNNQKFYFNYVKKKAFTSTSSSGMPSQVASNSDYYFLESIGDRCSLLSDISLVEINTGKDKLVKNRSKADKINQNNFVLTYPTFNQVLNCQTLDNGESNCFSTKSIPELGLKPYIPQNMDAILPLLYLETKKYYDNILSKIPKGSLYSR